MCLENYLLMLFTRKLLGLIAKNKKSAHLYAGRLIMRGFLRAKTKHKTKAHEGHICMFLILLLTPQKTGIIPALD